MNCYLIADHGVPVGLVILGVVFLVFSGSFSAARRARGAQCGRRGSWGGWGLSLIVICGLLFALLHKQQKTFEFRGELPTSWDARRSAPPTSMVSISERGIAVMTSPPPAPAAPEPAIVQWPAVPPVQEVARTAPPEKTSAADWKEKPQAQPIKSESPAVTSRERPAWVDASPGKRNGVYEAKASSGPWSTEVECEKALNQDLGRVVTNYLRDVRGDDQSVDGDVSLGYIKKNIVKDTYREIIDSPTVGPMVQFHARLEFSPEVQQEIQDRWRSEMVDKKLEHLTSGAVGLFALLGTLFGFLKVDALTQGKYRWRLGFGLASLWTVFLFLTMVWIAN
jgi:hypothetical protein